MVIFGAGGDLTKRLLVPALYNLAQTGLIPDAFALVGVDLVVRTAQAWADSLHEMLQSFVGNPSSESRLERIDDAVWRRLADAMSFLQGDLNDPGLYARLSSHVDELARQRGTEGTASSTSPSPTASSAR